jgi:hypothetical protein
VGEKKGEGERRTGIRKQIFIFERTDLSGTIWEGG